MEINTARTPAHGAHHAAAAQATRRWDSFIQSSPPWRLGGSGRSSVEAATASRQRSGGSCARPSSAMEANRSEGGRGREFYFFSRVQMRGSEDAITSGVDAFVRTDAHVKSLSFYKSHICSTKGLLAFLTAHIPHQLFQKA
jgi:hypothetical protein